MDEVYAGLGIFCHIPDGFKHCELGVGSNIDPKTLGEEERRALLDNPPSVILNPHQAHLEAIELFKMILEGHPKVCENGDCLRPTIGAYLYGRAGAGKTHIMAAFGHRIESELQTRIHEVMERFKGYIHACLRQYARAIDGGNKAIDLSAGVQQLRDPEEVLQNELEKAKKILVGMKYRPTDMLYLGFSDLCEIYAAPNTRKETIETIENAPIVFLDDVHSKGDSSRQQLIDTVIENRYASGRHGTFVTTNLPVDRIGDDDHAGHLSSRAAEMFVPLDFTDCDDWRETVKRFRVMDIQEEIRRRIAQHGTVS